MGNIFLLDCTLRDGGYINDWHFGYEGIRDIITGLSRSRVDFIEIGFLKGTGYDTGYSLYPDTESCRTILKGIRVPGVKYAAMLDMSAPVNIDAIGKRTPDGLDAIRVIFKKSKLEASVAYCRHIREQGYQLFVNFVSTDVYSDEELTRALQLFSELRPDGFTIVDTFGLIKRKQFLHFVRLFDRETDPAVMLCYHAHNNLQQAAGNAEAMCELELERDIMIDACVFGMGRGAGNLNIELFADYLNENYGKAYRIEPFLEIMDEHLTSVYRKRSWGYNLSFYLTAVSGCHPNYGVYYSALDTLTEKSFYQLLNTISPEDKAVYSRDRAEYYYQRFMEEYVDDTASRRKLTEALSGKKIIILAPGRSLVEEEETVTRVIRSDRARTAVIALNFSGGGFGADFVFSSNMRRYSRLPELPAGVKRIITSNIHDGSAEYTLNYSGYISRYPEIIDNSGLMLMRFLAEAGIREVSVAGMDGYSSYLENNYYDRELEADFSREQKERNRLISGELRDISKVMKLHFITQTHYEI